MHAALGITFGGGGDSNAGPSGSLIAVIILVLLIGVPIIVGVLLRVRDRRRGDDGDVGKPSGRPADAPLFGWGNVTSLRGQTNTPADSMIVGAFAVVVVVLLALRLA